MKEVETDVVILAVRSNSRGSGWPRRHSDLPVACTVDCRAYVGVTTELYNSLVQDPT